MWNQLNNTRYHQHRCRVRHRFGKYSHQALQFDCKSTIPLYNSFQNHLEGCIPILSAILLIRMKEHCCKTKIRWLQQLGESRNSVLTKIIEIDIQDPYIDRNTIHQSPEYRPNRVAPIIRDKQVL